jgi:hypothetical protein
MKLIFHACHDVLEELLTPVHYRKLTELALVKLDINIKDVNHSRQIEDVREKLLLSGRLGTFYTGPPKYLAGLKYWFESEQLYLFNMDVTKPVEIIGNVNSGVTGAFESLMRFPFMINKSTLANSEHRAMGCARGLVIEKHVSDWFLKNWSKIILPPDNDKKWANPCNHDFKIKIPNSDSVILVDIWGPNVNGEYNKPPMKKATHLHLQCRISPSGKSIVWESVIHGSLYDKKKSIVPEMGISPRRLIVWLNCLQNDIDYENVKKCIAKPPSGQPPNSHHG